MTDRVENPTHRSRYATKICYKCGKSIEGKHITKNTRKAKDISQFRFYHLVCWEDLFI